MTRPTDFPAPPVTDEAQPHSGSDAVPPPLPPPLSGLDAAGLFGAAASESVRAAGTPFSVIQPLFPAYEILAAAGAGGAGTVYRARHRKLGREVAIKVLHPERCVDGEFAERFRREAQAIARLEHPFIVGIHDFGDVEGVHYLVLEWCGGRTLRSLMAGSADDRRRALRVLAFACEAIHHAHASGTVHRDLKPENVLLDVHGYPRVADFGLARYRDPDTPTLTVTGDVMGTPHYMAPEQLAGQDAGASADVYAVAVMAYEALTGALPTGRFRAPSEVGDSLRDDLDEVVMAGLDADPAQRPGLIELREALLRSTGVERSAPARESSRDVAVAPGPSPLATPPLLAWRIVATALVLLSTFLPHMWFDVSGFGATRVTAWGWKSAMSLGPVSIPFWTLLPVFLADAVLVVVAWLRDRPVQPPWFPKLAAGVAGLGAVAALVLICGSMFGWLESTAGGPLRIESVQIGPGLGAALLGYAGLVATTLIPWFEARRAAGAASRSTRRHVRKLSLARRGQLAKARRKRRAPMRRQA